MVKQADFLCSSNVKTILRFLGVFLRGGGWGGAEHVQRPKFGKKKLDKALCSVQFLASFTSFYFEILSYLACGEKIIRLATKIA